jgi:hypothetical protein
LRADIRCGALFQQARFFGDRGGEDRAHPISLGLAGPGRDERGDGVE